MSKPRSDDWRVEVVLPMAMQDFDPPTEDCPFPKWEFIGTPIVRKVGVITVFEQGAFYGSPRDAVSYANRPSKKGKFGALIGFFFGEIIWGDPRMNFVFFHEDKRAKNRKDKIKRSKHLKARGIRVWEYDKYLKANPLERFFDESKPTKYPPTEEEVQAHLARRRERLERRDARKKQEKG